MNTHCAPADPSRGAAAAAPCLTSTAIVCTSCFCFIENGEKRSVVQMGFQPTAQLFDWRATELVRVHAVAVADGDLVVLERLEVDGDAKGRADLVLTAIQLADI